MLTNGFMHESTVSCVDSGAAFVVITAPFLFPTLKVMRKNA